MGMEVKQNTLAKGDGKMGLEIEATGMGFFVMQAIVGRDKRGRDIVEAVAEPVSDPLEFSDLIAWRCMSGLWTPDDARMLWQMALVLDMQRRLKGMPQTHPMCVYDELSVQRAASLCTLSAFHREVTKALGMRYRVIGSGRCGSSMEIIFKLGAPHQTAWMRSLGYAAADAEWAGNAGAPRVTAAGAPLVSFAPAPRFVDMLRELEPGATEQDAADFGEAYHVRITGLLRQERCNK